MATISPSTHFLVDFKKSKHSEPICHRKRRRTESIVAAISCFVSLGSSPLPNRDRVNSAATASKSGFTPIGSSCSDQTAKQRTLPWSDRAGKRRAFKYSERTLSRCGGDGLHFLFVIDCTLSRWQCLQKWTEREHPDGAIFDVECAQNINGSTLNVFRIGIGILDRCHLGNGRLLHFQCTLLFAVLIVIHWIDC